MPINPAHSRLRTMSCTHEYGEHVKKSLAISVLCYGKHKRTISPVDSIIAKARERILSGYCANDHAIFLIFYVGDHFEMLVNQETNAFTDSQGRVLHELFGETFEKIQTILEDTRLFHNLYDNPTIEYQRPPNPKEIKKYYAEKKRELRALAPFIQDRLV